MSSTKGLEEILGSQRGRREAVAPDGIDRTDVATDVRMQLDGTRAAVNVSTFPNYPPSANSPPLLVNPTNGDGRLLLPLKDY